MSFYLGCPTGWTLHNCNCYLLDTTTFRNFDAAQANCVSMGANLVTAHSDDEWTFIKGRGKRLTEGQETFI